MIEKKFLKKSKNEEHTPSRNVNNRMGNLFAKIFELIKFNHHHLFIKITLPKIYYTLYLLKRICNFY